MRQVLVLSALLLLGACASEGPLSGEVWQEPGVLPPPHAREQTVPSAGPLRLAKVGSYMDAQERDFRAHLKGFPVRRVGDDLVVSIDDGLLFEDRELSDHGSDTLETIARLLRHYDRSYVQVLGYTDTWAPRSQALQLTNERAKTVADALVTDGVAKPRVSAEGFGTARLKVATGPGKKEPRNRRVEIRIVANPQG